MQQDRNAFKAGLFIVISVALVVGVIVGVKGIGRFLEPDAKHSAVFNLKDDVGGLGIGDEVRLGGVRVGVVREIDFVTAKDGQPQVVIGFAIPERIKLGKDAVITIQMTVTGSSNLNIKNLGTGSSIAKAPPADPNSLVGEASGLSQLFETVGVLAPEITGTVRDVRMNTLPKINNAFEKAGDTAVAFKETGDEATALVKDVKGRVEPIVQRYNKVADKGAEALGNISDIFGDTKGDFRDTMKNLAGTTGTLKEKLPGILDRVTVAVDKISGVLDETKTALIDVKVIAANTRDATGNVRSILTSNRGKIDGMITSLKATGDNLKNATAEIRRSPWRLLYKPAPNEMANLNLYDAARQFAEGAQHLNDSTLALRDALKDPAASEEQLKLLSEKLDESFKGFSEVEKQLWERVK